MNIKKRVGVWVHGFLLQAEVWRKVVWGEPPDLLGRVPKAVLVALEEDAVFLGFGTGASEKDGKKEAEFIRDYLLEHFLELAEFTAFKGVDLVKAKEKIQSISRLETQSHNTKEESEFAVEMLEESGIEKIFLVSSPVHLPRCLRDYYAVLEKRQNTILVQNLYAIPSQTYWGEVGLGDLVIIEPPHRPDDSLGNLRLKVAKMLFRPDKLLEIKKALGL